jgi:HAD superfamily hydrolase (TIGR01484 family)
MMPLSDWPLAARRDIIGVFTDIDDTLTTDGAMTADALQALGDLTSVGLHVIAITGRPLGWSEQVAFGPDKAWPVDAVVAENGSTAMFFNKPRLPISQKVRESLSKIYQQDSATRSKNYERMQQVAQRVLREVSGAHLSQDSGGRETDIAIDHSEFTQLSAEKIAQAVQIMQSEGMNATVSSIHINGWFGDHNKLTGARWIVRELFGRELNAEMDRWVYVGDSTNDALMFEHFTHSVGVANIRRFEAQLLHKPRYITQTERGAGFAEVARALIQARL